MEVLFRYVAAPSRCGYLPDRQWSLEYEQVRSISDVEYMIRLRQGWRHFGHALFRPHCGACRACQSIRVSVDRFRPDRSQRRACKANDGDIDLVIGPPRVDSARLSLYDRFHEFQAHHKGWPDRPAKDAASYTEAFLINPFPVEEWAYYLHGNLIGIGFVDPLPEGLSAIYFFYDPELRDRSLGTYNVLRILEDARVRRLPHLYLGYFVAGCRSLEYKGRFVPNETLGEDGVWRPFRE